MSQMSRWYTWAGWMAVLYLVILFLYPLLQVIWTSVWVDEQVTLDNYLQIFTKTLYLDVLWQTLWIAAISTLLALLIGYALALFITNQPSHRQGFWLILVVSSMFMSLTIRLFGWMILLGEEGPVVKFLQMMMGPEMTPSFLFSPIAVAVGIVHYVLPFVVLTLYTTLKKIEPSLWEASTMLGASSVRTFWKVTFPLSLPGVYAGGSIAFALSSSTFLVPLMLGGPKDHLLANLAYNSIVTIGDMGMGAAISFLLLIIIVLVLTSVGILERRNHHGA